MLLLCKKSITSLIARCSIHALLIISTRLVTCGVSANRSGASSITVSVVEAKLFDDALRRHRADALDQPAAEVFLQPGDGGGQHRTEGFDLKLPPIFAVDGPAAG